MDPEVECAVWVTVVALRVLAPQTGAVCVSLCRRRLPPGCSKVEVSSLQTLADLKLQVGWAGCTPVGVTTVVTSSLLSPFPSFPLPIFPPSRLSPFPSFILKLMHIYGTCPSDMQVFFNGQELTRVDLALVELGIVPNSLLVVKVRGILGQVPS